MKLRILCLTTCYLPGYKFGGPLRTIVNMVEHLSDDFDFNIITSDRDSGDTIPYPGVQLGVWNQVGKARVFYMGEGRRSVSAFAKLLRETPYDVLYLNSFFDPVFTLRPLLALRFGMAPRRRSVLATRGEFSEGHLKLKALKKSLYIAIMPKTGLFKDITWQASTEFETEDIRRTLGKYAPRVAEAVDLPPAPSPSGEVGAQRERSPGDVLKVCFLSRVHPKKNLDYALVILRGIKVPVELNIYGPLFDEPYWEKCQALIDLLPSNIRVNYCGSIPPEEVPGVMADHDLFFFPTLGENYGHVIAEALSAGTPALLSDTTPWRQMEEAGVGWDLPLSSPEAFMHAIEYCATLGSEPYAVWRTHIREYALKRLTNPAVIEANKKLFLSA